jgi:hypothetical protein
VIGRWEIEDENAGQVSPVAWDGHEPITDALSRYALRAEFQTAVDGGEREAAERILCEVGADVATACEIVAVLIPECRDETK